MIEQLTEEQKASLPAHAEKWIRRANTCGPSDRPACEAAVKVLYESAGQPWPGVVHWVASPEAAVKLIKELGGDHTNALSQCGYGHHDAAWVANIATLVEFGADGSKELDAFIALVDTGFWWPYDTCVIMAERPSELHMDDRGRLDHLEGPAIRYSDGYGIYAVHGVVVPRWVIEEKEKITVDGIFSESNAEVRRVMMEIYGVEKLFEHATQVDFDFQVVDKASGEKIPRGLYRFKDGSQWLYVTDGSTERCYTLAVPNDVKTCREAHESITGYPEDTCLMRS